LNNQQEILATPGAVDRTVCVRHRTAQQSISLLIKLSNN